MQERELFASRHEQNPVGFRACARDLGEKFGSCDPYRNRKTNNVAYRSSELGRNVEGLADRTSRAAHVEEGFVDRDAFYEGRDVAKTIEHRAAGFEVGVEAGRDNDRVRTECFRRSFACWRCNTESFRLVTCRDNDAATDQHRTTAQCWIVALFDRGKKRIKVGVQNARLDERPGRCSLDRGLASCAGLVRARSNKHVRMFA